MTVPLRRRRRLQSLGRGVRLQPLAQLAVILLGAGELVFAW